MNGLHSRRRHQAQRVMRLAIEQLRKAIVLQYAINNDVVDYPADGASMREWAREVLEHAEVADLLFDPDCGAVNWR